MLSLGHIVERNAKLFPQRPAVESAELRLCHAELAVRVRQLSSALRARGLGKGDRFSVLSMNTADFLVAYLAASHGGLILNTVNFRLSVSEISWILNDAQPRLLIFEAQYAEIAAQLRDSVASIKHYVRVGGDEPLPDGVESYEALLAAGDGAAPLTLAHPDDDCCLMYTSGTTGKPKGVVHTVRSMASVAEIISSELGLSGATRLLAIAPLFHMGAATLSLAALYRGGTVILHRAFDADAVIRTIERERITAMHMVPTMVQAVLDSPVRNRHDLSSLKMLMYAAAPMPLALLKRAVAALGPIMVNGYGQTEINMLTLLHPHQHSLDGTPEQVRRLASVGQAHWQCEIRIVDNGGNTVPSGVIGEVTARSSTAMARYWNNDAATAATLREGWIRTGDVGYLDDEHYLFLVDRMKDVIISGGENIYSREVEDALASHPAVHECAVIGVPDAKWGETVKAVVVLSSGETATADELILFCKTQIAAFKAPKSIVFAAELPRLATGKISKQELRSRYAPAETS